VPRLPHCQALSRKTLYSLQRNQHRNHSRAAGEVIRRTGKRAIPQFVLNGEWVQPYRPGEGFLYEEMGELPGVSGN